MVKVQPTTDHDGVAAAAPSDLAEAAEAPAPACTQEHESDGTDKAPSRRSLVLKGHTRAVECLVVLDGGRLASGSRDKSIIVWNLADGKQLAKLEGHSDRVFALAALDGDRLASGGGEDSDIDESDEESSELLIWNVADGSQLTTLKGHTGAVECLAALDGDRLASGGGYEDRSIIIWNLADGSQVATLEGHKSWVNCLTALDGDRLASGSRDRSIIIWSLADGTQLAKLEGHEGSVLCLAALPGGRLVSGSADESIIIWSLADEKQLAKLEGHTDEVQCLAALDGDRLASGSADKSIVIWNVADGAQLAKLEGHTGWVNCLAALDGDRLASGSSDKTIRIRSLEKLTALVACRSAFEFEEVAGACREQNCLGDLFDAATGRIGDEKLTIPGAPSARVTTQAHVFDAIAKVITDDDNTVLVERLLGLVRDDDLLPDLKRQGVSDAAIEKLAPTALFRVVIDGKYVAGPRLLLYVEFVSFLVVMLCFARVATFEVLGWSNPWLLANKAFEKTAALVVAFAVLAYFSAREVGQIRSARAIELATPEDRISTKYNPATEKWEYEAQGLAWYALAIPRLLVLFVACLLLSPILLVFIPLACAGKEYEWMDAFGEWFEKTIGNPIGHDPLTFLGLPRAWRGDYWNWIDTATLGCAWAAFARAATPGTNLSTDHAAATAMLLWLRLFGFLKNINQSLATFVLMFERIVRDLRVFMVFFLMIILAFGSAFYLYLGQHEAEYYGFHDDGAPNAFESVRMTIFSLLLLGFIGDYDLDNYPKSADRTYLVLFLVVVVIVQLNILIAIVSDSYDAAMAKSEGLYYRSHLELVSETAWAAQRFPRRLLPTIDEGWIKKRLAAALEETKGGDDDQGRINYTSQRTRAMVQADTRRAIADLEARMDAKFDEVLKLLRARPA